MGEAQGYEVRDEAKLYSVVAEHGIPTKGRTIKEITLDVANKAIGEFGQQRGQLSYLYVLAETPGDLEGAGRGPAALTARWSRSCTARIWATTRTPATSSPPRCALRSPMVGAARCGPPTSSDILFGTPSPKVGEVNLGCLMDDEVNIIVHGHEPTLSEMIVTAVQDPELIEYAKSKGANGINLAGICCTSNEVMMRQGIPSAGTS